MGGAVEGSIAPPEALEVASAAMVGLDPGRRIGVAWVSADGTLLGSAIVELTELQRLPLPSGAQVVLGDGTGSRALAAALAALGVEAEPIDETGSSEEGRRLYWRRHPARGIARLLPPGLRSPPRPIDDFAAYAIALRALAGVGRRASSPDAG